mgnify:CR=1 FL=1
MHARHQNDSHPTWIRTATTHSIAQSQTKTSATRPERDSQHTFNYPEQPVQRRTANILRMHGKMAHDS